MVTRRALHGLAIAAAACVALSACSGDDGCTRGQDSVEGTVRALLTAGQNSDRTAMERELLPRFELSDSDIDQIHRRVEGVAVQDLFISSTSETVSRYQVSVVTQEGAMIAWFEAGDMDEEGQPGCFAVAYGHVPVDPSASVTPSATS